MITPYDLVFIVKSSAGNAADNEIRDAVAGALKELLR
jgi:hypothetical protein